MKKRKHGVIYGSYQCVSQSNTKKNSNPHDNAMKKAILILGQESIAELRTKWDTMNTKYGGEEWQQGEGIVLGLMHQGLYDNGHLGN